MSGFERFEATEAWKNKFKKLLFMERKTVLETSDEIKQTQRFSLDIDQDLKATMEQKSTSRHRDTPKVKMFNPENKENENRECHSLTKKPKKLVFAEKVLVDDTFMNCDEKDIKNETISDESFEVMEKMCNKTASDPNSTLFQYIHSENKQEIIDASKKRLSDMATQQTDSNITSHVDQLIDESPLKGVEMTQIEDIEAPSRFWENTLTYEPVLQTSPVKMVGLLRPSTILEEYGDDSDISSTCTSYTSAVKAPASEVSSSCYETASDSISYRKSVNFIKCENDYSIQNIDGNESINLIDLEKTMAASVCSPITDNLSGTEVPQVDFEAEMNDSNIDSDESVIELISDEEDIATSNNIRTSHIKKEDSESNSINRSDLIDWENSFVKHEVNRNSFSLDSPNNESKELSEGNESKGASLHFNDTLEEVEYMMKKGMEFIAAGATDTPSKPKHTNVPNVLKEKQNTFTLSPAKRNSPGISKKCVKDNPFQLNIKPIPKMDIFKKPTSPWKSKTTQLGARPKDPFPHVVSPIGTYVKKTATAPLIAHWNPVASDLDSTAFRELEIESRLLQPKVNDPDFLGVTPLPVSPGVCSLPKKAYISSEFRQVIDQRCPVTIPGGKKIQKYLDSAITPAVLCHDGKMKINNFSASKIPMGMQKTSKTAVNQPSTKDASLMNLSVMSGDVSVYTIKDAQKL